MLPSFCQNITIPCSAGNLEGRLNYREETSNKPGVILCPPHPLLAGNMDNNVIIALANSLAQHFPVLSFNYRGVGKSFKAEPDLPLFEYWDRLDQENDFSAIINDTRELMQWSARFFKTFHLVGYSFGSFIALSAMPESVLSYTAITPPLSEHNFEALTRLSCKTMLLFAENETLLTQEHFDTPSQAKIHEIANCDHFFLDREQEVVRIVQAFLLQNE